MNNFADTLKENIQWKQVFKCIVALGPQLDERMLRFLKARFIERAIARLSNDVIWVNRVGCDHELFDVRIETKSGTDLLTNKNNGILKQTNPRITSLLSLKLNNNQGKSKGKQLPQTFDWLMIVDQNAVGIIDYATVSNPEYLDDSTGEGLYLKIPHSRVTILKHYNLNEIKDSVEQSGIVVDIVNKIDNTIDEIIDLV
jgi:hypothetical protein